LLAEFAQGARDRHIHSADRHAGFLGDFLDRHGVSDFAGTAQDAHLALPHGTRGHAGAASRKRLYPSFDIGDVVPDGISKFSVERTPAQQTPVLKRFSRNSKAGFELNLVKEPPGSSGGS